MLRIATGDTVKHRVFGNVTVERITEHFEEADFTIRDDGDDRIFEGGTIGETEVEFTVQSTQKTQTESIDSFIDNVKLETDN